MDTEPCVLLRQVRHAYGRDREILTGVDLTVPRGGIFALLGLNGAGKTTLLRLLMGLIRPTSGKLEVMGKRLETGAPSPDWLARIGYVPERPFVGERTTPRELVHLVRAVHPRWDEATVQRYLAIFQVPLDRPSRDLSAGTKSQLALLLAMAGNPELLILDEPTLGLDPWHRRQYLQLLLREATERELTIVITSHDLLQIDRMADTVAILRDGRIAVEESADTLKTRVKRVRVGTTLEDPQLFERLKVLPGVAEVERGPGGYTLATTEMNLEFAATLRGLPGVENTQVVDLNLEEIFLIYCLRKDAPLSIPPI
jgi:ABC-2 type transport system ATP-binding protein